MSRTYTVEATTPDGPVEMVAEAAEGAPFAGVVDEIVDDFANQGGLRLDQIKVTSVWFTDGGH